MIHSLRSKDIVVVAEGAMRRAAWLLALAALVYGLAWAQNIEGTITGVVEDPSGRRIPGTTVAALNQDTGVRYPAITTEAGVYVIPQLPLGHYTVRVEASGFKTFVRKDLELGADARLRLDIRLELGGTTETVTVSGAAPLVELERGTVGASFTQQWFDRLPIGRNPLGVLALVPGSQQAQGSYATGIFNGGHEETTDYKVDGAPATRTNIRTAPQPPIEEMVEEVVLHSSNYSAEYGRGSSQVSVNTMAGTNKLHGVLFEYFQNEALNANSGQDRPACPTAARPGTTTKTTPLSRWSTPAWCDPIWSTPCDSATSSITGVCSGRERTRTGQDTGG